MTGTAARRMRAAGLSQAFPPAGRLCMKMAGPKLTSTICAKRYTPLPLTWLARRTAVAQLLVRDGELRDLTLRFRQLSLERERERREHQVSRAHRDERAPALVVIGVCASAHVWML